MTYILICRWISPHEPAPYNDEIAWLDGDGEEEWSLYHAMDNYLQRGYSMEILEVLGDVSFPSVEGMERLKGALRKHRDLHAVEGISYQMLKERGYA